MGSDPFAVRCNTLPASFGHLRAAKSGRATITRLELRAGGAIIRAQKVFEARIDEIGPGRRKQGVGIYNNNKEMTARERSCAS